MIRLIFGKCLPVAPHKAPVVDEAEFSERCRTRSLSQAWYVGVPPWM